MSQISPIHRHTATQPYCVPKTSSTDKTNTAEASATFSKAGYHDIAIRNSSTASILTYSTCETTTQTRQFPQADVPPSAISEDEISVRDSRAASILTFSACESFESVETIRGVQQLGDDGLEVSGVEDRARAQARISFEEPDWKRTGMTKSREPNERYDGGAKDNLSAGRVPLGLVGAARRGGGGDDREENLEDEGGEGSGNDGDEGGRGGPQRKRRGNLPKETTDKLRSWFHSHLHHPYPTEDEKQELMMVTGLQMNQISNWFINARRRQLPQLLNDQSGKNGTPVKNGSAPQAPMSSYQKGDARRYDDEDSEDSERGRRGRG